MNAKKVKNIRFNVLCFFLLGLFAVFALAPFYYLIISSFKDTTELFRAGMNFSFDISQATLKNYEILFTNRDGQYLLWYRNSLIIAVLYTVLSLVLSSMVGYGFAIYKFKGKKLLFYLVLSMLMVPIETLLLPIYRIMLSLKLVNSYLGVAIPFAVSPFAIFFFRQYVSTIPKDYIDSGRIDGSSEFGIFLRIMIPLMLPAFGAIAILQAMASWNDFLWPLIIMSSSDMFTIPIGLQSCLTPYGDNYSMILSGAVLSVIPIVLVFLFCQNTFIAGLTVGGIKE